MMVNSPVQIAVFPDVVTVGAAVVIPVKSELVAVIPVADNVCETVLVTPNFTHGNDPVYCPADMLASVPDTSPVT